MLSPVLKITSADHVEHKRQHDENDSDPLRHLCELCVHGAGLVLRHIGVGSAGDGAGESGTLSGLEQNDDGKSDAEDELDYRNNEL